MGYTTDFSGDWEITPPLKPEHAAYLRAFARTRRVTRDPVLAEARPDPLRIAAGLPIGPHGAYFVGETGHMGQDDADDIIADEPPGLPTFPPPADPNHPMADFNTRSHQYLLDKAEAMAKYETQPGYWCQWVPTSDTTLGWDGGEKFYEYEDWIIYLVRHFLAPWGYTLNGIVSWQGEEPDDRGRIIITDNQIDIAYATEPRYITKRLIQPPPRTPTVTTTENAWPTP